MLFIELWELLQRVVASLFNSRECGSQSIVGAHEHFFKIVSLWAVCIDHVEVQFGHRVVDQCWKL